MSDFWSDDPNSSRANPIERTGEKCGFRGILIATILHGIVIAFFCQCIGALLSPTNRRHKVGGMRWGLVALTTVMFLSSTTALALNLDALFFGYVSRWTNRNSPTLPGPLGSWFSPGTSSIILANMISLNQWLADGLLLYRCHVIYAKNYQVTAFPCLMYLASVSVGIVFVYESSQRLYPGKLNVFQTIPLYLAITFSLNVLLTLMIVGRLALCNQEVRNVIGVSSRGHMRTSSRAGEWCKAIATIFVESCAPYAISLLLYLIAERIGSPLVNIFYPIFVETQVIAPFLIILRLANRTVVTSDPTIGSRIIDPACFGTHEGTTCSYGVFPNEGPVGSADVRGDALNELSVGDGKAIEEVPLYDGCRAGSSSDKWLLEP